jgi:hypothetical protein
MDEVEETTTALTEEAPYPDAAAKEPTGFSPGVFAILALVLVLIAASNVWLRKRAERESASGE